MLLDDPAKQQAVGLEINANHLRSVREGWVYGRCTPDSHRPHDARLGRAHHRRTRQAGMCQPAYRSDTGGLMEQSHGVFRIRNRYLFWPWAFLLFFLSWTTGFTVSTLSVRHYPDLNDLPFIYLITGFCCVVWVGLSYRQTIYVQLADNFFAVKKAHRPLVRHTYTAYSGS
jgi:hypothetical protein